MKITLTSKREILRYTWRDYNKDLRKILNYLSNKRVKTLVGIAKGGLILGVHLANLLNVPLAIVSVKSYQDKEKMGNHYISLCAHSFIEPPVYVIDDIVDSGLTMKTILDCLRQYNPKCITIFYKPKSVIKPTFYCREVENQVWVEFWWESLRKKL